MIKTLNKWLAKFDKRIVSNEEYNVMMEGNAVYMSRVTDLMVIKSVNDYSVWVRKGGLNILIVNLTSIPRVKSQSSTPKYVPKIWQMLSAMQNNTNQ